MFKKMHKSLLTTILLLIFLTAKSQNFSINELIDLKRGDIELFQKKYVGKGWSAPRRKIFKRKRMALIKGLIKPDEILPELYLHYLPSKTKDYDSFIDIGYSKGQKNLN